MYYPRVLHIEQTFSETRNRNFGIAQPSAETESPNFGIWSNSPKPKTEISGFDQNRRNWTPKLRFTVFVYIPNNNDDLTTINKLK